MPSSTIFQLSIASFLGFLPYFLSTRRDVSRSWTATIHCAQALVKAWAAGLTGNALSKNRLAEYFTKKIYRTIEA